VAAPICRDVLREAQLRDPARQIPGKDTVAQTIEPDAASPPSRNHTGG
jgi:hypothetical protein